MLRRPNTNADAWPCVLPGLTPGGCTQLNRPASRSSGPALQPLTRGDGVADIAVGGDFHALAHGDARAACVDHLDVAVVHAQRQADRGGGAPARINRLLVA